MKIVYGEMESDRYWTMFGEVCYGERYRGLSVLARDGRPGIVTETGMWHQESHKFLGDRLSFSKVQFPWVWV